MEERSDGGLREIEKGGTGERRGRKSLREFEWFIERSPQARKRRKKIFFSLIDFDRIIIRKVEMGEKTSNNHVLIFAYCLKT